MKRLLACAFVAFAGLVVAPALASASPTSGTEHFQLTEANNTPGAILARGVFTASGVDYSKNNTSLEVFADGAFTIHHPGGNFSFTINPRTCLAKITITGSYTINNGYGRYQGIKGSGTYVANETGVVPRKANGTCSQRGEPFGTVTHITAHGPISF